MCRLGRPVARLWLPAGCFTLQQGQNQQAVLSTGSTGWYSDTRGAKDRISDWQEWHLSLTILAPGQPTEDSEEIIKEETPQQLLSQLCHLQSGNFPDPAAQPPDCNKSELALADEQSGFV